MVVSEENRLLYRAILIGRAVKWLFMAQPERPAWRLGTAK